MCRHHAALRGVSDTVHACQVAKECDSIVQQMVGLIKPPGGIMLPGPVSIVTLKGLGVISQQRPQYLGRILPTLLKLASVLTQPQVQISAGLGPATIPGMLSAELLSCVLLGTYRCACRCDFVLYQVKYVCFT